MGASVVEKEKPTKSSGKESSKDKEAKDTAKSPKSPNSANGIEEKPLRTLAIDIGATGLKATILNELGAPVTERARAPHQRNGGRKRSLAGSIARGATPYGHHADACR